jgi:hypothetical protein
MSDYPWIPQPENPLRAAARKHEHDDLDIQSVSNGRILLCHTCEKPIAEDR